eukprot:m.14098 g.14098  ORF g.14098 m.14098 type:complete len:160 (-) comp10300_c0_seq1:155-634(-)
MALSTVTNWLSYISSNIEATFAFFGFYSKLEYAKAQALKELEDEYCFHVGVIPSHCCSNQKQQLTFPCGPLNENISRYGLPASEVLKYDDDSENSMADEEEVAGDWNPEFENEAFDEYEDKDFGVDERSYEGFEYSDDEHLSPNEDDNLTVDEEEETDV